MEAQVYLTVAFGSSEFFGLLFVIFLSALPHRFSMGFRSIYGVQYDNRFSMGFRSIYGVQYDNRFSMGFRSIYGVQYDNRFSMGFRSGEFAGQSSTPTPKLWSFNQLLLLLAVWAGAKSCWKIKLASLKSWSAEGSMKCSKISW